MRTRTGGRIRFPCLGRLALDHTTPVGNIPLSRGRVDGRAAVHGCSRATIEAREDGGEA